MRTRINSKNNSVLERLGSEAKCRSLAVVIPVYRGEATLRSLIEEIAPFTRESCSPGGLRYQVHEVVLVNDGSPDGSPEVMRELARCFGFVRLIWLSRNFGQHAATLAGMSNTNSEWVVTIDEDGQQNPADMGRLLDAAIDNDALLVYAQASNGLPHSWFRNAASLVAKYFFSRLLGNAQLGRFNSFRLINGRIARTLGTYCGCNVYLDGALHWVAENPVCCPVVLRRDTARQSGYNYPKLFDHFMRLIFTSKRPPLRIVSFLGCFSLGLSILLGASAAWGKLTNHIPVPGWTSMVTIISFFSGLLLFSVGIIAEYLGILLAVSMGKPLYFIIPDVKQEQENANESKAAI